jgi:hypothetical protein
VDADGAGLPVAGLSPGEVEVAACVGAGVGGATHLVQIVDVIVLYTVEVVVLVCTTWLPPCVTVCVTGHVVR